MSKKTKNGGVSMSRLPGNRSAKFVPYLVPGLVGLLVIVVIPFVWNIYLSFTRWRGVGPVKFVGLQNWKRLFADSTFWISFANSFWIIVAIVVIPTILGLFISSLLTDVIQKKFGGKTASFLRAMFYLPQLLPISWPTISVLFVFFFVWTWNEYMIPMAFLMGDDVQTIPLALATLQGQRTMDATTLASASLLSIVPTIIFFIIFQRKLSQGITAGAVK